MQRNHFLNSSSSSSTTSLTFQHFLCSCSVNLPRSVEWMLLTLMHISLRSSFTGDSQKMIWLVKYHHICSIERRKAEFKGKTVEQGTRRRSNIIHTRFSSRLMMMILFPSENFGSSSFRWRIFRQMSSDVKVPPSSSNFPLFTTHETTLCQFLL